MPLFRLTVLAQTFEKGDLGLNQHQTMMADVESNDEIGVLSQSFDRIGAIRHFLHCRNHFLHLLIALGQTPPHILRLLLRFDTIEQVQAKIDQISSVVQNNSATSEESAATSEELRAQAGILKQLVNTFNLR